MSQQAEIAFRILMRLYIELDQRLGWTTEQQVVATMKTKENIAEGRSKDSLNLLRNFKMLEFRSVGATEQMKISPYGVQWFEKSCPMISRDPEYEFRMPILRSVKLVGPNEFYGRAKANASSSARQPDWTKWGAIAALVALPIPFIIWWLT